MIPKGSNQRVTDNVFEAIAKINESLGQFFKDNADPADDNTLLPFISTLKKTCPAPDSKAFEACLEAITCKSCYSKKDRRVVLARAGRYLMKLTIWLDENTKPQKIKQEPIQNPVLSNSQLNQELLGLKGIGKVSATRLTEKGITSPLELLYLLPKRYDDRRTIVPIRNLQPGMRVLTKGEVERCFSFGPKWKRSAGLFLKDNEHEITALWFGNKRPDVSKYPQGTRLLLFGLVSEGQKGLQMTHPSIYLPEEEQSLGIISTYPEIKGVPDSTLRKAIASCLDKINVHITDPIPEAILKKINLLPLEEALKLAHQPPQQTQPHILEEWIMGSSPAHKRLAYDEFFYLSLALLKRKKEEATKEAYCIKSNIATIDTLASQFGFKPTSEQKKVFSQIITDLRRKEPMRRLIQGDVGSGKTLVALAAIQACAKAGFQAALMAPTEILAQQHMRTIYPVLKKAGISCALHLGGARPKEKKKFLTHIQTGQIDVAIGTHSLIQENVVFKNLGLAIVDEQHRFGVSQRLKLTEKASDEYTPHLLVMTATPIPRTLALTVHGDLDISTLLELPEGRIPVKTTLLSGENRNIAFLAIKEAISRGEQAYIVCPTIWESEKMEISNVNSVYEEVLQLFSRDQVGLLHGQLDTDQREKVIDRFTNKEISLLVSTTIVEVGVNIPTATIMMIDGAERFGLSQLHQLRGRVGRSHLTSECFLYTNSSNKETLSRIQSLVSTNDGFEIAQMDLEHRGPGELYGKRQAGLPGFRFGNLKRDLTLLEAAREDACKLLESNCFSLDLQKELERRRASSSPIITEESG